jgi:lysophospholipase L1-like esterase
MAFSRIVCFGASSVYGRKDPQFGGFCGRLRSWHETLDSRNLVYNLGIGGETIEQMNRRFKLEVPVRRPHLIVFYSGYNDIVRRGSTTAPNTCDKTIYTQALYQLFKAALTEAKLLVILPLPFDQAQSTPLSGTDWNYLTADAIDYISAQRTIAQELEVEVIDLFFPYLESASGSALLSDDGLHPGPAGHALIFETLQAWLGKNRAA